MKSKIYVYKTKQITNNLKEFIKNWCFFDNDMTISKKIYEK